MTPGPILGAVQAGGHFWKELAATRPGGINRGFSIVFCPSPGRFAAVVGAEFAADRSLQFTQDTGGPPQHLKPRLIRAEPLGVHLHRPRLGKQPLV